MAKEWDQKFSQLVNTLEHLKPAFVKGKLDAAAIGEAVGNATEQMSDEQLDAFLEYVREQERQSQEKVQRFKAEIAEAEAELARRRKQ